MALYKIGDLYPDYRNDVFSGKDINDFSVYTQENEKVGSVHDVIVDEQGNFRYFVIDTGFWIFGKKVLLPAGQARLDYDNGRLYAPYLVQQQVEHLPEYDENMVIDYDYEERVRGVYRQPAAGQTTRTNTASTSMPAGQSTTTNTAAMSNRGYNRDTYNYREHDRDLYDLDRDEDRRTIKLYEERLTANKNRFRAGAVNIGKHVETETQRVSVPVEKERVVIERKSPTTGETVAPGEANFNDNEAVRMEIYEEKANIDKQAVVKEEVSVRKETQRETVEGQETIRREELDVDVDGNPIINDR